MKSKTKTRIDKTPNAATGEIRGASRLSLRTRLILLVVASILPLTSFTLVRRYLDYREAVENAGQKTLELTRGLAIAIGKDLQARIAVLEVMARSRSLQEGNLDAFRIQAETVMSDQFPGSNILLLRENGQQVMNTRLPPGTPLPARRNLQSLRQVFATGRPAVSDVFEGVVAQLPLISIDVPVKRLDGTVAYVLSLNPPFDAFADTIRRQRLPDGWIASVVDRQGVAVARNRDPERHVGQKVVPALLERLTAEPEGVLITTSREGIEVVSAFSHVQPYGWAVATGLPFSDLTGPAIDAVLRVLGVAGAALLISLILAGIVARQVTGPMLTLRRLATAADSNEILKAPSTGLAEADEVLHALIVAERDRRRSETERNQVERQAQRIFETSQDVILVTDGYGKIVQVSPSAVKALGYQPEEMVGHGSQEFVLPEDLDATRNEMREARRGRATRHFTCRYVHKDGHVVPLSWMAVWSEPDRRHFFIGRDMTEYESAEAQLRQAQKMEAVGQLTGGIAHDFNNILMVIMANVDALEDERSGDPLLLGRAKEIGEATQRAADLTRQLLAFSRKQALRPQRTNINDLIVVTSQLLRRSLGERIEIDLSLADDLWNTEIDRSQLESAVVNLAINARDAMPGGGRLLIETRNVALEADYAAQNPGVATGDYVMLAITDTGVGIPANMLDRVFEPFFTTKEVGKGTGLGLSMVYGFIKQSGGNTKIYSEVGRGTSIRLYLPRYEGEKEQAAARPSVSIPGGSERVLVVEDDSGVRAGVVLQLASLGYAVLAVSNGAEALAAVEAAPQPFALLLTDVVMPGPLTGEDLAKEVVRRWPGTKVVFMSGYTEDAVVSHGRLEADVLLLSKPFRKSELAIMLRQALDGAEES
jgi:PAS domain S-box-containing protein